MKSTALTFSVLLVFIFILFTVSSSVASSANDPVIQPIEMFCRSSNLEALKAYNDAHEMQKHGNFDEAIELYRAAIKLDPKFCDAMDNIGLLLRQQGEIEKAITWYKKSLKILPDNTAALQNLGVAYAFQGKPREAISIYEKLIQIAQDNPEGYYGIGNIYLKLQNPEQAIKYFEIAEKLYSDISSPQIVDTQYNLGFAYFLMNNYMKAKDYFEPIYNLYKEDAYVNCALGTYYFNKEPPDNNLAKEYLLKAQKLGFIIPPEVFKNLEGNN